MAYAQDIFSEFQQASAVPAKFVCYCLDHGGFTSATVAVKQNVICRPAGKEYPCIFYCQSLLVFHKIKPVKGYRIRVFYRNKVLRRTVVNKEIMTAENAGAVFPMP